MGIKQLYNDNSRKLPNEYGEVSVMYNIRHAVVIVMNEFQVCDLNTEYVS